LAHELSKTATGQTLYLIDEPTTGLSFYESTKLKDVMQAPALDKGNFDRGDRAQPRCNSAALTG